MKYEHYTVRTGIRKHKGMLKTLANMLTKEMQSRGSVRNPVYLDFRFLTILSQWVAEQGGYNLHPSGNNPGNVMGSGDAGKVHQSTNHEVVDGKSVVVPADFAAYSTLEMGTSATFDNLRRRWPNAYRALLEGASAESYALGLYPGRGKNYATLSHSSYLNRLRYRLDNVIQDYVAMAKDDMKEMDQFEKNVSSGKTAVDDVSQANNQAEVVKYLSQEMLDELHAIAKRLRTHADLQP